MRPVPILTFDFTECARAKSVTKQIVAYLDLVSTTQQLLGHLALFTFDGLLKIGRERRSRLEVPGCRTSVTSKNTRRELSHVTVVTRIHNFAEDNANCHLYTLARSNSLYQLYCTCASYTECYLLLTAFSLFLCCLFMSVCLSVCLFYGEINAF